MTLIHVHTGNMWIRGAFMLCCVVLCFGNMCICVCVYGAERESKHVQCVIICALASLFIFTVLKKYCCFCAAMQIGTGWCNIAKLVLPQTAYTLVCLTWNMKPFPTEKKVHCFVFFQPTEQILTQWQLWRNRITSLLSWHEKSFI